MNRRNRKNIVVAVSILIGIAVLLIVVAQLMG